MARKTSRRGATALEFGLVLPLAVGLMAGIMDFAWFMFEQLSMVVATGRGVRIAGGVAEDEDPETAAEASTKKWMDLFGLDSASADVEASLDSATTPPTITVTATMEFDPLVGFLWPMPEQIGSTSSGVYYSYMY